MILTEHGLRFVLYAPGKWQCVELPALRKHGLDYLWKDRPGVYETLSDALQVLRRPRLAVCGAPPDGPPATGADDGGTAG